MTRDEYQCANCKGIYTKGWSDEEMITEGIEAGFGDTDNCIVCDDCYKKIMGWTNDNS